MNSVPALETFKPIGNRTVVLNCKLNLYFTYLIIYNRAFVIFSIDSAKIMIWIYFGKRVSKTCCAIIWLTYRSLIVILSFAVQSLESRLDRQVFNLNTVNHP